MPVPLSLHACPSVLRQQGGILLKLLLGLVILLLIGAALLFKLRPELLATLQTKPAIPASSAVQAPVENPKPIVPPSDSRQLVQTVLLSSEDVLGELMARGEQVYERACAACHMPTGAGMPPVFPALKGSAIATGAPAGHIAIVVDGKPGTAMAAFGKQLSAVDLAAVITYERNAWGNAVGDRVTPQDVAAYQQAKE